MKRQYYIWFVMAPAMIFAVIFAKKSSIAPLLLVEDIEALSECEATFPNASNQMETIWCKGSQGTCHIKKKSKVKTNFGTYNVWVDATCDGIEVKL